MMLGDINDNLLPNNDLCATRTCLTKQRNTRVHVRAYTCRYIISVFRSFNFILVRVFLFSIKNYSNCCEQIRVTR